MGNLEFSVPFNHDEGTLRYIFANRERNGNAIREVYLSAPRSVAGSGRVATDMPMEQFVGTVRRIREAGIDVDITMNSTCEGAGWYDGDAVAGTVEFVRRMHEDEGVRAVTLANPFHIEAVRNACPDLEISASVLSDIDCFSRAKTFADAGATTFTPDTSINRDLKLLGAIHRRLGLEVKLMVNEGCLNKCPYRKFHMNYISHVSREGEHEGEAFSFACGDLIRKDTANLFRSNWVRPEELSRYEGITSFFKIVGRDMLASKVIRCIGAYMDEDYDGNLLDLLCSSLGFYNVEESAFVDNKALGASSYFKRLSTCNRACHKCDYCDGLVRQFLRYGRVTEENLLDMGQYDLLNMVKSQFGGKFPVCGDYSETPRAR